MATLKQVREKIDGWLAPRWPWLVEKQEAYFAKHGHYFQGLATHSVEPDGELAEVVPDRLADKPSDQPHAWDELVGNALDALPLPCMLEIHAYDGPMGHGWRAVLTVLYRGDLYRRAKSYGPYGGDRPWHRVLRMDEQ